jgi:hypothetical protein
MTPTKEPVHLNHHHRTTLQRIFQHPMSHNIEWHDVESLLAAVGKVEERRDGKLVVTVGIEKKSFVHTRQKDLDADQVVDLRKMLGDAGYTADEHTADEQTPGGSPDAG